MLPTALARAATSGLLLSLPTLLAACDRDSGPDWITGTEGSLTAGGTGNEKPKPGGGTFFLDPHHDGEATALHLAEMFWGRLVDIHDVDDTGEVRPEPWFRDFVVNENVQTDGNNYTLTTNPLTQRTRLVIHAKKGSALFDDLLRATTFGLPPILPKHENAAPPFSLVVRNACLVLRFDDLLDDDASAQEQLFDTVRARVGYPPHIPFGARLVFDPNHGGVAGGEFHSTRVLVDLTVSERESADMPVPQPVNVIGLPASAPELTGANVSLRLPTRTDPGSGQFWLLTNLGGAALDPAANGPVDLASPTQDVVRAMRSGNQTDVNNGFLLDLERPRLVGSMPLVVERADAVAEREFLLNVRFSTACELSPAPPDVLVAGAEPLEVIAPARLGPQGLVRKLRVRSADPIPNPASLLGTGLLSPVFHPTRAPRLPPACWLSFLPQPPAPTSGVSTTAQVLAHFSEPMDPAPALDLDSFLVVRGPAEATSTAHSSTTVLGQVLVGSGLDSFAFSPLLPFAHTQGIADAYHVELRDWRDLAGNRLRHDLPFANFRIDPDEETQANGAVVLRFSGVDEVGPDGFPDLRGQFFFDAGRERILPRPVVTSSWPIDRTVPVPSIMTPFAPGVNSPLVPLGSKLQSVWRYCDAGWNVRDETKYNLDVSGLSWSPVGGLALADFYPQFEIRLAHSRFLPDESLDAFLLPRYSQSGLRGGPNLFTDNILVDPLSPQKVVHPRALGYAVNPANTFVASTGTIMHPYPLNRGPGPDVTYTWRDTAVLAKAGPNNAGIPMDIETGPPLFLEPDPPGTLASAGSVPSIGLPLLIEYRCYPSATSIGLNALDISLAVASDPQPNFRAFTSGGFDTNGNPVIVNPDTALVPMGGTNPLSTPPGLPTRSAECLFYIGQLDTVTRVSRVHTIWLDTAVASPDYFIPVALPPAQAQPDGTQVALHFRGATGFSPDALQAPFDATQIDAYGDIETGTVVFAGGTPVWSDDIDTLDGARYVQARLTFVNNVESGASPELTALGIAFLTD